MKLDFLYKDRSKIKADFILPKLLGTPFPIFNHVHKINNSKRLDMNQLYRKFKDLPPEAQNIYVNAMHYSWIQAYRELKAAFARRSVFTVYLPNSQRNLHEKLGLYIDLAKKYPEKSHSQLMKEAVRYYRDKIMSRKNLSAMHVFNIDPYKLRCASPLRSGLLKTNAWALFIRARVPQFPPTTPSTERLKLLKVEWDSMKAEEKQTYVQVDRENLLENIIRQQKMLEAATPEDRLMTYKSKLEALLRRDKVDPLSSHYDALMQIYTRRTENPFASVEEEQKAVNSIIEEAVQVGGEDAGFRKASFFKYLQTHFKEVAESLGSTDTAEVTQALAIQWNQVTRDKKLRDYWVPRKCARVPPSPSYPRFAAYVRDHFAEVSKEIGSSSLSVVTPELAKRYRESRKHASSESSKAKKEVKPSSGYVWFVKRNYERASREMGSRYAASVTKKLGLEWRGLSDDEKRRYMHEYKQFLDERNAANG